jgi:hypothetical protein
MIEL